MGAGFGRFDARGICVPLVTSKSAVNVELSYGFILIKISGFWFPLF